MRDIIRVYDLETPQGEIEVVKINHLQELLASLNATFDYSHFVLSENYVDARALLDSLKDSDDTLASKLTTQFDSLSLKAKRVMKRLSIKVTRLMRQAIKSHSEEPEAKPKQVFESLVKEAFAKILGHEAQIMEEAAFYSAIKASGVRKSDERIESLSRLLEINDDKQLMMSRLVQVVAAMLTSDFFKRIKSRVSLLFI